MYLNHSKKSTIVALNNRLKSLKPRQLDELQKKILANKLARARRDSDKRHPAVELIVPELKVLPAQLHAVFLRQRHFRIPIDLKTGLMQEFTCSICLDEWLPNICELSCEHQFHTECIENWFATVDSNKKCPLCKQTMIVKKEKKCDISQKYERQVWNTKMIMAAAKQNLLLFMDESIFEQ